MTQSENANNEQQHEGKTKNGQPQEPKPSRDVTVIVYGASDDLVEVEGPVRGADEYGCYETAGGILTFSDGTKLRINYGPDGTGCWRIKRIAEGTAKYSHVPATDERTDYSDRVTLVGDIAWVRFRKSKAGAKDFPAGASVPAVDPSRSTPAVDDLISENSHVR